MHDMIAAPDIRHEPLWYWHVAPLEEAIEGDV
jgi:hypothetical protein